MSDFWKSLFDFLQKILPTLLGGITLGYQYASKQTQKAQAALRDITLKLQYKENHDEIEKKFSGKSPSDIVHSIASKKPDDSE